MTRLLLVLLTAATLASDWPRWRGPHGDGVSGDTAVPLRWSRTDKVAWKVAVPGMGHSSPIVTGDRVLLTTFHADDNSRRLLCFRKSDGKLLWQATVVTAAPEKMHRNNSPASATPAADGTHVWTTFLANGNIVVSCHDLSGKPVWQKSFAGFASQHGFCGSPVLHDGMVVVNGDSDGDAFLAALDAKTGEQRWRTPRPNQVRSFSAPLFIDVEKRRQMLLAGSKSVTSYDPATGKVIWVADSTTDKFVATVAYADGVVCATGTSPTHTLVGIDPRGKGNVTRSHVLWSDNKGAAYVPSPLGFDHYFFVLSDQGLASLLEAKTGNRKWVKRLDRPHNASPLLIGRHVYCLSTEGEMTVLKAGPEFAVVARNSLEETCHATPAVSDGQLFIRTTEHLWCIGSPGAKLGTRR